MMTSKLRRATEVLLALALLAPLPSFAIGRDLTTVRIATPDPDGGRPVTCATEKGFLLRWGSTTRALGTTADADGVPRLPASSMFPFSQQLLPSGDGCLALSENGFAELDADGAVRRNVAFDTPLFFAVAAFDGTNLFLLRGVVGEGWTGRLVDRNGHVLATTKLAIAEGDPGALDITASPDGGFTVFVAQAAAGIYAIRISAAGQVTGTVNVTFGNGGSGYRVAIATNAALGRTVAAWTTSGAGSAYVHTVALNGGSAGPEVILPGGSERTTKIALLPSGSGFILLRNTTTIETPSHERLLALRLDATGAPREASPTFLLNGAFTAAAANSRALVVLAYGEEVNSTLNEVSAAITDTGIVPSATYDVLATAVRQMEPVVASDGVDFFGVWLETTSTTDTIMATRVTRSGLPLDGTGLVVAETPRVPNGYLYGPSVAFGAGVYLVVFSSGPHPQNNIMGRRYARDGTPIDPAPFVISRNGNFPSVAFGGGRFLVAWILATEASVGGATVGSDGIVGTEQLLTPPRPLELPEESGSVGLPVIGWNGRHFIVACDLGYRTRVLRTSPLGVPLDAHTTAVSNEGSDSTIACSDQECVVSFIGDGGIEVAVVHDDAALHADVPKVVTGQYDYYAYAAVAFDGSSYVLAWRTGDSLLGVARLSRGGQPYGLAITGAAKAFPAADPGSTPSYPLSPPALAANSAGDTAIVTTEFNPVWMIDRARFYLASELPPPRRRAAGP